MAETKTAPKGTAGAKPAQGGPATGAQANAKPPEPPISKLEAVRRTMKKLGDSATPSEMKPYIKAKFGHDMTTDHISTSKGDILRKARQAAEAAQLTASGRKPAAAAAAPSSAKTAAAPTSAKAADGAILLEDVLIAKDLLDRVGVDNLRTLIDGLAD
jgi:hypothetical protein